MSDSIRDIFLVVVIGVGLYYLVYPYLTRNGIIRESYSDDINLDTDTNTAMKGMPEDNPASNSTTISNNLSGASGDAKNLGVESGAFPAALLEDRRSRAPLDAEDLVPSDPNSAWSTINPEGQGSIAYKNFLEATTLFGIDTIGSSLRNANTQLRSEPPNPRITVSPWMQSTVTLDTNKRELEVGESN